MVAPSLLQLTCFASHLERVAESLDGVAADP